MPVVATPFSSPAAPRRGAEPSKAARPAAVSAALGPRSLDELASLTPAALEALYCGAATPALESMNGHLVGRMLVGPIFPGWMAGLVRRFAAWAWFPWRGKSFAAGNGARGEGINRVFGDRKPRRWFRFETFVAPSRAGAFAAVQLDYDNPGNPRLIRAIKDEVREVAPGLYLGQAYLVWRDKPRLMLYFGLTHP
jgi:hypothetical protein